MSTKSVIVSHRINEATTPNEVYEINQPNI